MVQRKSKLITNALNDEMKDQYQKDHDKDFDLRKSIHKQQLDLDFIIKDKEVTAEEIEAKIEREVSKTKTEKMDDFLNNRPTMPMNGGGANDALQAVL